MELTVQTPRKGWLASIRAALEEKISNWFSRSKKEMVKQAAADDGTAFFPFVLAGPAVDIIDEGKNIKVVAELPGLSVDEFSVSVDGRRLFLKGEKKACHEETGRGYTYRECSFGAFSRVIPLPEEVQPGESTASFENGLLKIELKKLDGGKGRLISVDVK